VACSQWPEAPVAQQCSHPAAAGAQSGVVPVASSRSPPASAVLTSEQAAETERKQLLPPAVPVVSAAEAQVYLLQPSLAWLAPVLLRIRPERRRP